MSTESMLTDGWICPGDAAASMLTDGWICSPEEAIYKVFALAYLVPVLVESGSMVAAGYAIAEMKKGMAVAGSLVPDFSGGAIVPGAIAGAMVSSDPSGGMVSDGSSGAMAGELASGVMASVLPSSGKLVPDDPAGDLAEINPIAGTLKEDP